MLRKYTLKSVIFALWLAYKETMRGEVQTWSFEKRVKQSIKGRELLLIILFSAIGGGLGGLIHNPYDVPNYILGAETMLSGGNIYTHTHVTYPPLLYSIGAILLFIIERLPILDQFQGQYLRVASFAAIGAFIQSVVFVLGAKTIRSEYHLQWVVACLLNPFVIYATLAFGQMDIFVALGLVGAIYAVRTESWEVGGLTIAIATSVKIYPAAFLLPLLVYNRKHATRIITGTLPVVIFIGVLMVAYYPESLTILNPPASLRPVNVVNVLSGGSIGFAHVDRLFKIVFIGATLFAVLAPIEEELRYLIPVVPVALLYPTLIEYRWVPLAIGPLLIGYLDKPSLSESQRIYRYFGWAITVIGTASMFTGTLEGWIEGTPWIVPTIGQLPPVPLTVGLDALGMAREFLSVMVLISVCTATFALSISTVRKYQSNE